VLVLPDIIEPGLRLVVVEAAVGECSFRRGNHYAGRGDSFWDLLRDSGLTPRRLQPHEDAGVSAYGIGLVSLVKVDGATFDVDGLLQRIVSCRPQVVAFNGKAAAAAVARSQGHPRPSLGPQSWTVLGRGVFVLPSSSGANRRASYDGRRTRLQWWEELAESVRASAWEE
jgi:TDG/mug DNA glycosylase family protein